MTDQKDYIKFYITQLRLDKIIYAVEAVAANLACILLVVFSNFFFEDPWRSLVSGAFLLIGPVLTVYVGYANFRRLQKIKKLNSHLV